MSSELPSVTIEPLEERTRRWWDQPRFPPCGNWDALQPETQATIQLLYVAAVQIGRDEKTAALQRELEQERAGRVRAEEILGRLHVVVPQILAASGWAPSRVAGLSLMQRAEQIARCSEPSEETR